jgi:hypothetical protein
MMEDEEETLDVIVFSGEVSHRTNEVRIVKAK